MSLAQVEPAPPAPPPAALERFRELAPEQLRWTCDPAQLPFDTTSEVEELDGVLGQPRAVAAMELGVAIGGPGYNLFALGPPGIGKRYVVERYLEGQALRLPPPEDWCYVYDFADGDKDQKDLLGGKGANLAELANLGLPVPPTAKAP